MHATRSVRRIDSIDVSKTTSAQTSVQTIASSSPPSSAFDTDARFGGETRRDAVVRSFVLKR